ncbi:hypothetical protein [Actinoallomurus oryzae]|uniref:hypothetical protein n=1 Tax=Actinoallomurus oryzae TaxID=502180 RepID=UPI003CD0747D
MSAAQVARCGLRPGDHVERAARSPRPGNRREKFRRLVRLGTVNGRPANNPSNTGKRPEFADLTSLSPQERLRPETGRDELTRRVTDLTAPIGKGRRGLIAAPPKVGRTMGLQALAKAVRAADSGCQLMSSWSTNGPLNCSSASSATPSHGDGG